MNHTTYTNRVFKLAAVPLALLVGACSSIQPVPLAPPNLAIETKADAEDIRKDVEPIVGALSLDEAIARALKYNLERRTRMMEEALALNQLDVSKYDMLPKFMAQAGYAWRNNDRISLSRNSTNGDLSPSTFVSQDRTHMMNELGFSWNLLDFGLGYYGARQAADRVLVAAEKRRKAMHLLMQDVRTSYWRAASAQKLRSEVEKTVVMAEAALEDARKVEASRVRNPLDSLRYQRQLQENLRLLEGIDKELASAQVELASLINAPIGQPFQIAEAAPQDLAPVLQIPLQRLEESALANNADLREQHYNKRIAAEEVRRTMLKLYPNLSVNYAVKYDSDSYLVNRNWQESGVQMSFNIFNLLTGPTQLKLAEAGVGLADQRRLATQLAVMTQVHLARMQLQTARSQYRRSEAIFDTDRKIAEQITLRQSVQSVSQLERVSNDTSAILSLLRRYQALAQLQAAESRLLATIGLEPEIGSTRELSLAELTKQVSAQNNPWVTLTAAQPETK